MTEQEKTYYENLKTKKFDYIFDQLFTEVDGQLQPIEGKWFKLMPDGIPYIYSTDKSRVELENQIENMSYQSPLEKIKVSPNTFEKISESISKNSPFGENSFFHPNYEKKQEEERLEREKLNDRLTGNQNKPKSACTCKVHTKAKNFNELIALVKDAEEMMIKNKLKDLGDRINCLRGIYYGAEWSLDFQQEKSEMRNSGFLLYTTYTVEQDARVMLKCSENCKGNLFQALYESPEVNDSSTRVTDFGHLMIGLDARRSYTAKHLNLPYGGTGLENVTWIGDIGGGAGMLALKRVKDPTIRAKKLVFDSQHDYGCSINIEGDIAGYVVGLDDKNWKKIDDPTDNMEYIYMRV